MNDSKHFLGFNARTWWTLVIAVAVSSIVSLAASWIIVHHFNESQNSQQAAYRADQDRRQEQARKALEAKFQQTVKISGAQNAYSINKGVCGWRAFGQPQLARAIKRRKDYPNETAQARALNENAIKTLTGFLNNQVTTPPDFECSTLPTRPPKP